MAPANTEGNEEHLSKREESVELLPKQKEGEERLSGEGKGENQLAGEEKSEEEFAEKEKDEEHFDGNELDEPAENGNEDVLKKNEFNAPEKKGGGKRRKMFILAGIGLALLTASGYLYRQGGKEETVQVKKRPLRAAGSLVFDSFVIPLNEHDRFTYISLSISFKLSNNKIEKEMAEKRDQLRGIIYDTLKEEISRTGQVPPLDKIKTYIIRRVNQALSTGEVDEAYIVDFLAV